MKSDIMNLIENKDYSELSETEKFSIDSSIGENQYRIMRKSIDLSKKALKNDFEQLYFKEDFTSIISEKRKRIWDKQVPVYWAAASLIGFLFTFAALIIGANKQTVYISANPELQTIVLRDTIETIKEKLVYVSKPIITYRTKDENYVEDSGIDCCSIEVTANEYGAMTNFEKSKQFFGGKSLKDDTLKLKITSVQVNDRINY